MPRNVGNHAPCAAAARERKRSVNPKRIPLRTLLAIVATLLEAPRDRLGRLDLVDYDNGRVDERREAIEIIRELAVNNCLTPSRDTLEQLAKVIRVHIEKEAK